MQLVEAHAYWAVIVRVGTRAGVHALLAVLERAKRDARGIALESISISNR